MEANREVEGGSKRSGSRIQSRRSRSILRLADGGRVAQVEENAWGRAGVSGGWKAGADASPGRGG